MSYSNPVIITADLLKSVESDFSRSPDFFRYINYNFPAGAPYPLIRDEVVKFSNPFELDCLVYDYLNLAEKIEADELSIIPESDFTTICEQDPIYIYRNGDSVYNKYDNVKINSIGNLARITNQGKRAKITISGDESLIVNTAIKQTPPDDPNEIQYIDTFGGSEIILTGNRGRIISSAVKTKIIVTGTKNRIISRGAYDEIFDAGIGSKIIATGHCSSVTSKIYSTITLGDGCTASVKYFDSKTKTFKHACACGGENIKSYVPYFITDTGKFVEAAPAAAYSADEDDIVEYDPDFVFYTDWRKS